jgi:MoxR-like ATPase
MSTLIPLPTPSSPSRPAPASVVEIDPVANLRAALNAALRGKEQVIEQVIACVLARGHLLIEDVPGLGKTTLAKALAHAVGGRFSRVQCTPDLLPGDITGFAMFNQKTREFEFLPGPVFADVLLVDEINRATPRTQSALLEAMAEKQVTVDNTLHTLGESFFVIATQNPREHHGTYPLPEAQLDRFAAKLSIGYPDEDHELEMLGSAIGRCCGGPELPAAILTPHTLHELQQRVAAIEVVEPVRRYLVAIGRATRLHPRVTLGLSPRGLLTWQRYAQAWAHLRGRSFVTPDDIQETATPVLSVRLGLDGRDDAAVIAEILRSVPVPGVE